MLKNTVGKAACVAHSWLTSWGLSVEYTTKDKAAPGLTINGKHTVSFTGDGDFNLDPVKVASTVLQTTLDELHTVTEALGLGRPGPARPQDGKLRSSTDDYEDVVMRITQFKRTANPPPGAMAPFMPVVKREAQRAFRRHYALFTSMSYDWEDVYQIASILAINHYHQYMTQKWDPQTNGKFLTHYLQQQLERLALVTSQKARNVTFCATGVHPWDTVGSPTEGAVVESGQGGEACYTIEEPQETPVAPTKAQSKADLEAALAGMSRERVLEVLRDIAGNQYCNFYARKLAKAKLAKLEAAT